MNKEFFVPSQLPYPRYFVSLAVMDPEAGSNPVAGHTTLFISRQKTLEDKIEALEAISFYGIPPSSDPEGSYSKWIKRKLRLDVDLFNGGYGQLQREEARWISQGKGIRGINYVIDESAYSQLIEAVKAQYETEQQAIREAEETLTAQGVPTIRYQGKDKHTSHAILDAERERAAQAGEPPRLGPWEVFFSLNDYYLPTLRESKTCKTGTLKWLQHAGICGEEASRYGTGHSTGAFPRFFSRFNYQGEAPSQIRLHAVGGKLTHQSKRTGKVTIYNEWAPTFGEYDAEKSFESSKEAREERTKLFWTIPPQTLKLSTTTKDCDLARLESFYQLPQQFVKPISSLTQSFQDLAEFLIQRTPQSFAQEDPQSFATLRATLTNFIQEAFTYPKRNQDEEYLATTLAKGRKILRAIADGLTNADGICKLPMAREAISTIHIGLNEKEKARAIKLLPADLRPEPQPATPRGCVIL